MPSARNSGTIVVDNGVEVGIGQTETSDDSTNHNLADSAAGGMHAYSHNDDDNDDSSSSGSEIGAESSDAGEKSKKMRILRRVDILRKRTQISSHESMSRGPNGLNFTMDVHNVDNSCTCGDDSWQNGCPGWTCVDFVDLSLSFFSGSKMSNETSNRRRNDIKTDKRIKTFALLSGEVTALRLKISVNFARMDGQLFWYALSVAKESSGLIKNKGRKSVIIPIQLNTISVETVSDSQVTEGSGLESFRDVLRKGQIRAEVWSTTKDVGYNGPALEDLDTESEDEVIDEAFLNLPGRCSRDQRNNFRMEARIRPVNENHRKIGYLEFTSRKFPLQSGRSSSSQGAASPAEDRRVQRQPLDASSPCHVKAAASHRKKRKVNPAKTDQDVEYHHKGKKRIAKVVVVARSLDDLIRQSIKAGQFDFTGQLCSIDARLPKSEVLEKLGVSLFTLEKAGIEMTEDQIRRREKEKEVHCVDTGSEESDDSAPRGKDEDAGVEQINKSSSSSDKNGGQNKPEDDYEEETSDRPRNSYERVEASIDPGSADEEMRHSLQQEEQAISRNSSSPETGAAEYDTAGFDDEPHDANETEKQRRRSVNNADAEVAEEAALPNEKVQKTSSTIRRKQGKGTHPPCEVPNEGVSNVAESDSASVDLSYSLPRSQEEVARREPCQSTKPPHLLPKKKKTLIQRVTDAEGQITGEEAAGIRNLPARVRCLERELGLGDSTAPLVGRIGYLEDVLAGRVGPSRGSVRQRVAALEREAFGDAQSDSELPLAARINAVNAELGIDESDGTLMSRISELEQYLL